MTLGHYEDFTLEELRAMRRRAVEQRTKGVLSFSYNGQAFTYSDPARMWAVIEEMTREIKRRMAIQLGLQPVDTSLPATFRPLAGKA